jgi:hypothetical protein
MGGCFITVTNGGGTSKERNANNIEIAPLIHNPVAVSPANDLFSGMVFPQE